MDARSLGAAAGNGTLGRQETVSGHELVAHDLRGAQALLEVVQNFGGQRVEAIGKRLRKLERNHICRSKRGTETAVRML